ncbi:2Fe-2S iron-sulfur cluster-binding protein [Aquabacterium sp.]|uniref:2Fe-2S iron-sulfur cluster-binding protein n=1 Tax=Aquabacterium sp. TaxID=1872578 RepID=UPI0037841DCB
MSGDATPAFRLRVLPAGDEVPAPADRTLLQSAQAAMLPLRSSCRNGTCRTCMCRLIEGRIHYRIEWPGLLAEEQREGWILPCVAYPDSDVAITLARD